VIEQAQLRDSSDDAWLEHYAEEIYRYMKRCVGKIALELGCNRKTPTIIEKIGAFMID
jgi:hypothetical protein